MGVLVVNVKGYYEAVLKKERMWQCVPPLEHSLALFAANIKTILLITNIFAKKSEFLGKKRGKRG